jgi:hypothetical protein
MTKNFVISALGINLVVQFFVLPPAGMTQRPDFHPTNIQRETLGLYRLCLASWGLKM